MSATKNWLDAVKWNAEGLVPAIAQETGSGKILMMAWMNRDALEETADSGKAVYWSRSRRALWRKGEQSGHQQRVKSIRLDCDGDTVLLEVEQLGGIACHTGRHNCFFSELRDGAWVVVEPIIKPADQIYSKS